MPPIEVHPLQPFLPPAARVLMLGSFPPPRQRWSMDFFYPNFANDMWRVMGQVFFADKDHFVDRAHKTFRLEALRQFLTEKGIALYDTASAVRRTEGSAADSNLEIVEPTDIAALLRQLPRCQAIITTGDLATRLLAQSLALPALPRIGAPVDTSIGGNSICCHRLPSTSRRLPGPIEQKAAAYAEILKFLNQ